MKHLWVSGTGILFFIASPSAMADEIGFAGSAGLQYKQLEFENTIHASSTLEGTGNLSASLPTMNLQAIAFSDRLYFVLKGEWTIEEQATDSSVPFTTDNTDLQTGVKREDYSLSVGYHLSDNLNLFGGYMSGTSELTPEAGKCYVAVCETWAGRMEYNGFSNYHQEYTEQGFFAGGSYSWNIFNGKLSSSLAYALMDGQYKDNYRSSTGDNEAFNFEGNSTGYSAALTWAAPLNANVAYFIDARYQQYQMEADDFYKEINTTTQTEEILFGLTAGLQVLF